ncbi:single-stranded DNA-binding protein [Streptomyces sp. ISL-43]|uniref:single-stranded DNA-binding protein n=1 Tax=Streptomyces sp. ISL-43 TaxID=2819183 RepID=UPI001BE9FFBE|nr:single-stranded DNA-binding protein [Streptomyces sp. ISL-43]MBT2451268.1 single-stranded DNA-binding protein [Streptomyces sp. ISL-43]
MAEREPEQAKNFDAPAVAKALGTQAQEVTDPAYGDGQHFQVRSNGSFLSLDTFPQSGVSRITTKSARIELFGGMLPRVEDEGIVFLQKDSDHEHSTVSLSPDGGMTMGYQVDTGPVSVPGLPDEVKDTEQIITRSEAVQTPAEEAESQPDGVVSASKPPEKPERSLGAFPDVRPMIQQVSVSAEPAPTPQEPGTTDKPEDEHPLDHAARLRDQDQQAKQETAEAGAERVKLIGRIGRTPTVRETAGGKLIAKFPLAIHLEDGTTKWQDVLAFGDRAQALQKRAEAGELVKGNEVEVVGYAHTREYKGRDGTPKTAQEIYSVAVKRR